MKTVLWILLLVVGCSGCRKASTTTNGQEYIRIEESANPTNDFKNAIAVNDLRFVGYTGVALIVPGVTNYYMGYDKSNGVKIIDGTSDVVSLDSFPINVAHRYAMAYNELLLGYLKSNQQKQKGGLQTNN